MASSLRNRSSDRISYNNVCLWMISFHLLDMLSTDIVLYHGSSTAVETNAIAASAHGGPWIIFLRLGTVLITYISLRSAKFKPSEFNMILHFSAFQIANAKKGMFGTIINVKISIIVIFCVVSISRLFAAISNMSGEIFGVSVTIVVENVFEIASIRLIGFISTTILSLISLFVICVIWDKFRQRRILSATDSESYDVGS